MARGGRTPCKPGDVMRCGISVRRLPMRYLALFTVNAAAGCGGALMPTASQLKALNPVHYLLSTRQSGHSGALRSLRARCLLSRSATKHTTSRYAVWPVLGTAISIWEPSCHSLKDVMEMKSGRAFNAALSEVS
ncbi:hypothetical protein EYF80_052716 [Liparis tanakae]|uniref:Uncharacterized protein n=1 Tax=Liparis tanakae TaxID=230148 RepID=A0A4Z2F8A1_9TELE|nr:hypothetical protein EYF80_052716 [Liparis tanakae]